MKIKDFIAFVYTNELLAKTSFEGILKMVGPQLMKEKLFPTS